MKVFIFPLKNQFIGDFDMSEKKIESRRAFFKKAGKVLGAAVAVPFLAVATKEAVAANANQDGSESGCKDSCIGSCKLSCSDACTTLCARTCSWGCSRTCTNSCDASCLGTCMRVSSGSSK